MIEQHNHDLKQIITVFGEWWNKESFYCQHGHIECKNVGVEQDLNKHDLSMKIGHMTNVS